MTQVTYGIFMPVPPVVPANAYGVAVAVISTSASWWFARREPEATKWDGSAMGLTILSLVLSAVIMSYGALKSAIDVGYLGMLVGIMLYGAPLTTLGEVIKSKSSETLPALQCFLGFLNSTCWFMVGWRNRAVPVWGPNIIGMFLSLVQLLGFA